MSNIKNWLMDQEEEFYAIAEKTIGGCEAFAEFAAEMDKHKDKVTWNMDNPEIEFGDLLADMWHDFWAKYA